MKKRSEEPKSMNQGGGKMDECTREIACLLPHPHELTTPLAIRAELTTILGLVRLVWLARATINPAWLSRRTTITVLMV
jgi:hypothetical protein